MAFTTIQGSGANDATTFVGTSGVDTITLINSLGNFFLGAQEANDVVSFASTGFTDARVITNATVRAGSGDDVISGYGGNGGFFNGVFFNGNAGADLFNFAFNDQFAGSTIQGGQGADIINTGVLASSLVNGNRDNDTINVIGIAANSSIFGGQGNDTISIRNNLTNVIVNGDADNDTITSNFNLNLSGSTFLGGAGNDTINLSSVLTSTALVPTSGVLIDGGEGNDALVGTGNADTITGGAGNDTITGGAGADVMTGGAGSNRFVINNGDSGNLATGAVDLITDFRSTDVISGTGFLVAAVAQGVVAGYTTYALAAAAADLAGGNFIAAVGAVGGTSFTSYLFNGGAAGGANLSAALQLGATGSYTSTALAMSAVVAANIVA